MRYKRILKHYFSAPSVMPFSARNRFLTVCRWASLSSFQYRLIISSDSLRPNKSSGVGSATRCTRPLRVGSGMLPGRPWKKNDTGVSMATLSSNRRDADMRLPALSYFWICWNVTPQILDKSFWDRPIITRRNCIRWPMCSSTDVGINGLPLISLLAGCKCYCKKRFLYITYLYLFSFSFAIKKLI